MIVKRDLFQREPTEEDRVKDFLKNFFSMIERLWSFDLVKDTFEIWCIEREMEEDFQNEAIREEERDDF